MNIKTMQDRVVVVTGNGSRGWQAIANSGSLVGRRFFGGAWIAMIAVFASAFCASSVQAQDLKGVTDKEIRVGTMAALTGPLAANGISVQAGVTAVVNTVNEQGGINGRKIKLLSEDNAFSAPQALAVVRKMVANEGIFSLVAGHATPQVGAVLPYLIDQQKVPVFGSYGALTQWYNPPREGLFGLFVGAEDQGRALGRWAAKDGHKKIMTLYIDGTSYAPSALEVEKGFRGTAKDGSIEQVSVKFGTTDYAPVVIRIAQFRPDAIVVLLSEFETVLLAKELRNQRIQAPLYGWVPVVSQNLLALGGPAVEGMRALSQTISPTEDSAAAKEYRDALAKYYPSEKPDFYSLFGYASAKVFVEGLSRVKGKLSPAEFYKALYTMKNYNGGLLGPVTFSPERHQGNTGLFPMQIVSGKWKTVGSVVDTSSAN